MAAKSATPTPATPAPDYGDDVTLYPKFDLLPIKEELLRGIYSFGFEQPSMVQQKAIVPILTGRDVIVQAQSGTGKTGAFTIGMLERIDTKLKACQAIILSPTRELAMQSHSVVTALSEYMDIVAHCAIGGTSVSDEGKILARGVHVLSLIHI